MIYFQVFHGYTYVPLHAYPSTGNIYYPNKTITNYLPLFLQYGHWAPSLPLTGSECNLVKLNGSRFLLGVCIETVKIPARYKKILNTSVAEDCLYKCSINLQHLSPFLYPLTTCIWMYMNVCKLYTAYRRLHFIIIQ